MKHSAVYSCKISQTPDLRIDAGYWHPSFIKNSKLVSENKRIKDYVSRDILNIKSSPANKDFEYLEISGISLNNLVYNTNQIQKEEPPDRAHYILKKNDVVVSTVRPNRNAVAFIDRDGIIGSSGLSVLRANGIEPEYLFVFCKTDYFVKCLIRANKATMYPAVSNNDILNAPLFLPSKSFRGIIKNNMQKALSYIAQSNEVFFEAQSLLLSKLGLTGWKSKSRLAFTKSYIDFKEAGRIDAAYFQPKYEDVINKIKGYKKGWDILQNLAFVKDGNFKPKRETLYKYIELSHISSSGGITGCITEKGGNLPNRARRIVSKGDIIISSIEGSLSKIALIDQEHDQAVCSNGFYVINSNKLNSETMLLLMKSIAGQSQLKKGCSGMILTSINKDEFYKIVFPMLDADAQAQIQNMVIKSLNLHRESKKLLECGKYAVEKAIEKDEISAAAWLKDKLSKI